MDKPKKGNTITIKLNGENKKFEEESVNKELVPNNEPNPPVIKIESNLPESEGLLETAAAQESVDESFDWIIPESSENDIEDFKIATNKSSKKSGPKILTTFSTNSIKNNGRNIGSIIISAFFAVLIGTTIGFFMLKLVITDQTNKVTTAPNVVEEKGTTQGTGTGSGTGSGTGKNTAKATSAVMNQFTAFVVQGGAFSSKESTQEISKEIGSHSVPSQTIEMNGKFYLFLGVADSIETAKSLGNQYKEKGVADVFAKPLLLDEKKVSDITEKEKSFIEAVPTIYKTLAIATSDALVTKAISEESTKDLAAIEGPLKISGLKNEKVKALKAELASADEKVKAFQKSKKAKSLTEAQQHLLNFMSLYFSM